MLQGCDFHNYNTRQRSLFRTENHRLKLHETLPFQAGVKLINRLPDNIKNVHNLRLFKIKLKQYLLNKSYYSVEEFMEDDDI